MLDCACWGEKGLRDPKYKLIIGVTRLSQVWLFPALNQSHQRHLLPSTLPVEDSSQKATGRDD